MTPEERAKYLAELFSYDEERLIEDLEHLPPSWHEARWNRIHDHLTKRIASDVAEIKACVNPPQEDGAASTETVIKIMVDAVNRGIAERDRYFEQKQESGRRLGVERAKRQRMVVVAKSAMQYPDDASYLLRRLEAIVNIGEGGSDDDYRATIQDRIQGLSGYALMAVMDEFIASPEFWSHFAEGIETRFRDATIIVAIRRMERRALRGLAAAMLLGTVVDTFEPNQFTELLNLYIEGMENVMRWMALDLEGEDADRVDAMIRGLGLEPLDRKALRERADNLAEAESILASTADDLDGERLRLPPDRGMQEKDQHTLFRVEVEDSLLQVFLYEGLEGRGQDTMARTVADLLRHVRNAFGWDIEELHDAIGIELSRYSDEDRELKEEQQQ